MPTVSGVRPVSMAAVVMFGLGGATILTVIVVPVLYCMFHGVKYRPLDHM